MKTKNKMAITLVMATIIIVPNWALAVWWNPFTWFTKKQVEKPVISQIDTNSVESNLIVTPQKSKEVKNIEKNTPKIETKTVKKMSTQNALISEFLASPTLENFKVFCEKAKTLDGKKTKEVLSPDKQSLITQKESMFSDFKECNFGNKSIDVSSKEYLYDNPYSLLSLDKNLLINLENDDPDWLRESKLLYNNKINKLLEESKIKIVIFNNSSRKLEVKNPKDLFNFYLDKISKNEKEVKMTEADDELSIMTINILEGVTEETKTKIKSIYKNINEIKISNDLYE